MINISYFLDFHTHLLAPHAIQELDQFQDFLEPLRTEFMYARARSLRKRVLNNICVDMYTLANTDV